MPTKKTRALGSTDMKWTPIGLGTWDMERDAKKSIRALQAGLDEGANHIDTAEMYGSGRVESLVGEAIQGRRDQVFLVSKVLPSNADYDGTIAACHRSLARLKTGHLDVYLLHWRQKNKPLAETVRAFETLKQGGKIRAWGVSNFDVEDMEELAALAGAENIACNQVLYHLRERAIEIKLIPWCRARNIPIVAYSPLGQGKMPQHAALDAVAEDHGVSAAQAALAFLIRDPNVFAVPKSADERRARDNVRAADLALSTAEIKKISDAFPAKPRRGLPMI